MKTGLIYNIQRFCTHDGPGIRTVVFLKGCSLRCKWCCNPESQASLPELMHIRKLCLMCGACAAGCPNKAILMTPSGPSINRSLCKTCGICTTKCCSEALQIAGKQYGVEEICSIILQDEPFFRNSGGGLTFSGGEPLLQADFVLEVLKKIKRIGIHTAIETSGAAEWQAIEKVSPFVDLFLYDLKHLVDSSHKEGTKAGNKLILENFTKLAQEHKNVIARVPLIPNYNMDDDCIRKIGDFVKEQGLRVIHLLPYHRLGQGKYENLGRDYPLADLLPPAKDEVNRIASMLKHETKLEVVIDG